VNDKFDAVTELLSMKALKDITTGDGLHESPPETLERYKLL
jgi:hypothetical protein